MCVCESMRVYVCVSERVSSGLCQLPFNPQKEVVPISLWWYDFSVAGHLSLCLCLCVCPCERENVSRGGSECLTDCHISFS